MAVAAAVAGCAAPGSSPGTGAPRQEAGSDPGFGHVHGIDLNPADGLIYVAGHNGVFRLGPEGPHRIADRYQDTMGFVVAGPDLFLASGHPDVREPGPPHLGLIRSTDRAQTWANVSLAGEADFHSLTVTGATIYGLNSTDGLVMRSDDHGENWHRGAKLGVAYLESDPDDPLRVLATTPDGLQESTDGGLTFTAASEQPPRLLAVVDHTEEDGAKADPVLAGVDGDGGVWEFRDAAWSQTGALPGAPQAFTALAPGRYAAATAEGVLTSDDGGRSWRMITAATG
ncbi:F510_1955 family glycosylhydrolase [Pseudonocardia sichuanensis]